MSFNQTVFLILVNIVLGIIILLLVKSYRNTVKLFRLFVKKERLREGLRIIRKKDQRDWGRWGLSKPDNLSKLDTLDLVITVIQEHERKLSGLVDRLEKIYTESS